MKEPEEQLMMNKEAKGRAAAAGEQGVYGAGGGYRAGGHGGGNYRAGAGGG